MSITVQPTGVSSVEKRWEPELLLTIAWQRKAWVVGAVLISVAVSAGVGFYLPKTFQSIATISVVKKRPDAVVVGYATDGTMSPPQELLKSTLIIDRAVQAKGLASLSMYADQDLNISEAIRNSVSVVATRNPTGPSHVFKLTCKGRSPEDCQFVLNAILDSYKEYMDKKHQSVSEDTVELIVRDKQSLEKQIAAKEAAYLAFRETAPLMGIRKDGLELRQERLTGIQTKRSDLLMQRIQVEAQLTAIQVARKEGRSQEALLAMLAEFARKTDGVDPGAEKLRLADTLFPLLMEEKKLLQTHGPKHPDVLSVQQRIAVAQKLFIMPASAWNDKAGAGAPPDPVERNVQLLEQKLSHLKISEDLLTKLFLTEQDEARRLSTFEIQNDSFRSNLAMNQSLYESLTKRLNEVSLIRNAGGYEIELIEPPSLTRRSTPSMAVTLGVGALIGLLGGIGLGFWAERRDLRAARA